MPYFNRCVVFSTTSTSYHGHPEPLNCPGGETRKSIALYYYSKERPAEEHGPAHNTLFQARPGEDLETPSGASSLRAEKLYAAIRAIAPPILLEAWRRWRSRRA